MIVRQTRDDHDDGAPPPSPLAVGQLLGRYRIEAVLGAGGMGTVLRARDLDLDREVALKVATRTDNARDRRRAEQLLAEARAMARLRARHVRAVHDVGSTNGIDYIAMEYIPGRDLAAWLATPRTTADIVRVFGAAGRGLAAAHAAGIVHRDFKPSNVLVGDDGEVTVTDFGIAHWLHAGTPPPAGGTPGYQAPERDLDARSDQYSFCVALAEALAGRDLAARLAAAIERGRSRDPDARFPSMDALVAEIEATPRRWPIAVAVAACVLAVLAVFLLTREPPTTALPLHEAHALLDRNLLADARALAESAARRDDPRTRAAATYVLGEIALREENTQLARTHLDAAIGLADAAADDRTRAHALLASFQLAVTRGSDDDVARRAERAATAALARIPTDRTTRARLAFMQAILATRAGTPADLASVRAIVDPPRSLRELVVWSEITRTLLNLALDANELDRAHALARELVATADRTGGRDHFTALAARGELAIVLERLGRDDDAAAVMTELRAAAQTPDGRKLLPPAPTARPITVTVHDASGRPQQGALVVAARRFRSNGTHLLGAASIYDEHDRGTATAVTGTDGRAVLTVAGDDLWVAAEHREHGRALPMRLADSSTTVLAPWSSLAGSTTPHAGIKIVPAAAAAPMAIEVTADATGSFRVARISHGRYHVAACRAAANAELCRARRIDVPSPAVAIPIPAGDASLTVHVRDELGRPIESSYVLLGPTTYTPRDTREVEDGWLAALADRDAVLAVAAIHGDEPAKLTTLPPGSYRLCAAALHGDSADPMVSSQLARALPLHCIAITLPPHAIEHTLAVPERQRVWLGR